jgi:hypothetical protein
MKNIILIIALVSFVGLESCSDRNPTPTYTLSSEFKDYFGSAVFYGELGKKLT